MVRSQASAVSLETTGEAIRLISNSAPHVHIIARSILIDNFSYFRDLFDSSFADASNKEFRIEPLPDVNNTIEGFLFGIYPRSVPGEPWLIELCRNKTLLRLRQLSILNNLANFYGVDLQESCESAVQYYWKSHIEGLTRDSSSKRDKPRRIADKTSLATYFTTVRTLARTSQHTDTNGYPLIQTAFFQPFLRLNSDLLAMAHELPLDKRDQFWPELLDFCTRSSCGQSRWPGLVIPYFRIMRSFPARPEAGDTIDVLEVLVQAMDVAHFASMKSHRESNGHQHGEYALHSREMIQLMSRKQLVWCFVHWSNSEGEGRSEREGYQTLVDRLRRIWSSLVLGEELVDLTKDERRRLEQIMEQ